MSSELDRWLPEYEFAERHEIEIHAAPDRVDRAVREVSLGEIPIARALWGLRSLPAALRGRRRPDATAEPFLLQMAAQAGAVVVDDRPGEELVLGITGRFWRLVPDRAPRPRDAAEFEAYARPESGKAVMNFRIERSNGSCRLSTVTRVHVEDRAARRRFARYWLVIRPFSGLIRVLMLRAIRRRAEATA